MSDFPKYYSGLINIEAQAESNITLGTINHYTSDGDITTYDYTHLIPDFDENNPAFLKIIELDHIPIKESFMLILDGLVLSPTSSVPTAEWDAGTRGDYTFTAPDKITMEGDGIQRHSAEDTPVLLARYSRK